MIEKVSAAVDVLRKGNEVSNVEAWKTHQMTGNVVGAFILACFAFGKAFHWFDVPMGADDAMVIGGSVVAIWNFVCTVVSTKRAGILPAKPAPEPVPVPEPEPVPAVPEVVQSENDPDVFEKGVRF